jgi:hypothetical protein
MVAIMASFLNARSGKAEEGPQRMTLFPFPMKLARGFFRMGMKKITEPTRPGDR